MGNAKQNKILIKASKLEKSIGGKKILKGVDFSLSEGKNLVIVGRSGSGKSVFLKCLVGLLTPERGTLELFDEEVLNDTTAMIAARQKIGFLFQGGALYDSMTIEENLTFAIWRRKPTFDRQSAKKRVEKALDDVGLIDTIKKRPADLSGGMQKRVALARALVLNPSVMIYDEPTTGLDAITSDEISELILKMQAERNMASIIVTHDIKCAEKTANQLMVLEAGQKIEEGSFQEVRKSSNKKASALLV